MRQRKLSETMQREWAREPCSKDLWKLLGSTARGSSERLRSLERLAAQGSVLAKLMTADIYLHGRHGAVVDKPLGRQILEQAFSEGSVEAGYRLARLLQAEARQNEAKEIFIQLADANYSPAIWQIGYGYIEGCWGENNSEKSLPYFSKAAELGHLPSRYWMYWLNLKSAQSISSAFPLFFRLIYLNVYMEILSLTYPNSDRIRVW